MNELTQQGIAALKSGDRAAARQLLTAAIKQDAGDVTAWLWLTGTLEKDEERIACLRKVLQLDPANQAAARGLAQIMERRAGQQAQAASPAAPAAPAGQVEPARSMPVSSAAPNPEAPLKQIQTDSTAAASETPAPVSRFRRKARPAADPADRPVFRARMSLVPALLCFWLFLFGTIVVAALLKDAQGVGLLLATGLGIALEALVLYVIILGLGTRYELTSQQLNLRYPVKVNRWITLARARIPLTDIYHSEMTQSFLQRLVGIGNIEIDAAVNGELAHLKIRNIPQVRRRAEQIKYTVQENASA